MIVGTSYNIVSPLMGGAWRGVHTHKSIWGAWLVAFLTRLSGYIGRKLVVKLLWVTGQKIIQFTSNCK